MEINLLPFRTYKSTSFIGREDGKRARQRLNLDEYDRNNEKYTFILPADTTSFNPSFFLGFFRESIESLGIEAYAQKYSFVFETTNEDVIKTLVENIKDGLRNTLNVMSDKVGTGLW